MQTREASLSDKVKLAKVFGEDTIVEWLQVSRDNPIHLTVVTIERQQVQIAILCSIDALGVVCIHNLWSASNIQPEQIKYALDKIISLYAAKQIKVAGFIITDRPHNETLELLAFQPITCVYKKEVTV